MLRETTNDEGKGLRTVTTFAKTIVPTVLNTLELSQDEQFSVVIKVLWT